MMELFKRHTFFSQYWERFEVWSIDRAYYGVKPDYYPGTASLNEDSIGPWIVQEMAKHLKLKYVPSKKTPLGRHIIGYVENTQVIYFAGTNHGNIRADKGPGSSGWINIAVNNEASVVHEFGHSFGGLADEYCTYYPASGSPPEAPNQADDKVKGYSCKDKWGDMLGLKYHFNPKLTNVLESYQYSTRFPRKGVPLGCHLGCSAVNYSRPTVDIKSTTAKSQVGGYPGSFYRQALCLMGKDGLWPFCPVCMRHLEKTMHRHGTGQTTISFDHFPDGGPINQTISLSGNEFLAKGIRISSTEPKKTKL